MYVLLPCSFAGEEFAGEEEEEVTGEEEDSMVEERREDGVEERRRWSGGEVEWRRGEDGVEEKNEEVRRRGPRPAIYTA